MIASRWAAEGALLLGGGFIAVACATGGGAGGEPLSLVLEGYEGGVVAPEDVAGSGSGSSGASSSGGATGSNSSGGSNGGSDDATVASGPSAPLPCSTTTCPAGCCDNGVCKNGMDDNACGQGGNACTDCTTTNALCSFGNCVANTMTSDPSTGSSGGSSAPSMPSGPMPPNLNLGSCDLTSCKNFCFPLGLPCCTKAGGCGCIALYFLPCN